MRENKKTKIELRRNSKSSDIRTEKETKEKKIRRNNYTSFTYIKNIIFPKKISASANEQMKKQKKTNKGTIETPKRKQKTKRERNKQQKRIGSDAASAILLKRRERGELRMHWTENKSRYIYGLGLPV